MKQKTNFFLNKIPAIGVQVTFISNPTITNYSMTCHNGFGHVIMVLNRFSAVLCKNKMVAHTGSMDKKVKNISSLQTEITCNITVTNMIFFNSFFFFIFVFCLF